MSVLVQITGLIAPVLFLYAYAMVSLGKWNSGAMKFHVLNLFGGAFILLSLTQQWNVAVCVLECCWCSISAYGIWKAMRQNAAV